MFRIRVVFLILLAAAVIIVSSCARVDEVPELPSGFVFLEEIDGSITQAMVYAGRANFIGAPVDGYDVPACILTRQAAHALSQAQTSAREAGFSLIVFDCYRPQVAVDHFVRWSKLPPNNTERSFYPNIRKSRLFADGYIARRSGHSRGSTVDVGLIPAKLSKRSLALAPPNGACIGDVQTPVLDFGTRFDCFDPRSSTQASNINADARVNRERLLSLMTAAGWENYPKEWWHFTLKNEPFTDRYFTFPIRRATRPER